MIDMGAPPSTEVEAGTEPAGELETAGDAGGAA